MSPEVLLPGLKFANKHNLTQKEIEILVPFLEKPYTTFELSEVLGVHKTTLHHLIQRLKLKSLLVLKDRNKNGVNLYEFNSQSIGFNEGKNKIKSKEVKQMGDEKTETEEAVPDAVEDGAKEAEEESEDEKDSE